MTTSFVRWKMAWLASMLELEEERKGKKWESGSTSIYMWACLGKDEREGKEASDTHDTISCSI